MTGPDSEREFSQALERFESALRDVLQGEAKRSIDAALQRLPAGPFDVRDVEFDVVIRNLTLESRGSATAAPAHTGPVRRRRGRPQGAVRTAILASFDGGAELSTTSLRERLTDAGIETSTDGLHQQLRRLTMAGELVRAGRGVYRRR